MFLGFNDYALVEEDPKLHGCFALRIIKHFMGSSSADHAAILALNHLPGSNCHTDFEDSVRIMTNKVFEIITQNTLKDLFMPTKAFRTQLIQTSWSMAEGSTVEYLVQLTGVIGSVSILCTNKKSPNLLQIKVSPSQDWFQGVEDLGNRQIEMLRKQAIELELTVRSSRRMAISSWARAEQHQSEHRRIRAASSKFLFTIISLPLILKVTPQS